MLDEFKITINGFVNMKDGKCVELEETMNENWFNLNTNLNLNFIWKNEIFFFLFFFILSSFIKILFKMIKRKKK